MFGQFLLYISIPFVLITLFVASRKGGYYDTEDYKGNGCAH